jgi:hypothetical protein
MRRLITIIMALTLLAVPALATAKVPVGGKTRTEIIVAATGAHPAQFGCYETFLASKGSPWALQTTPTSDYQKAACRQIQAGGFGILRYSGGRWHVVSEADEVKCPFLSDPHEPTIPNMILRELTGKSCDQLPKTPTGDGPTQYKPWYLTISADGSDYFGGSTGHRLEPRRFHDIGRLNWTQYTAESAEASGQSWGLYGPGPLGADHTFEDEGHVSLHAFDPVDGVFSKMTVHFDPETIQTSDGRTLHLGASTTTVTAGYSNGSWYW